MNARGPNGVPDAQVVLDVQGVTRDYRTSQRRTPLRALEDVSLRVGRGTVVAIVGESGAGKSTLARLTIGLERPDCGEIWFEGRNLSALSPRQRRSEQRRMHMIMQDPYGSLHPAMRVRDLVAEPLVIARVAQEERTERVEEAMREVGLLPLHRFVDRRPHELSGGQRQRVAFARAIVGKPSLIVADEPTSMLDASLRAVILELVHEIRDRWATSFLFITHDLALARFAADDLVVLSRGRIVDQGPCETVLQHPTHPTTIALLNASRGTRARSNTHD